MKTILVTGGAGAIGSNLVKKLLLLGHKVVILDDLSSGALQLVDPEATFIQGSVCDSSRLDEAFAHRPDYVFHLAAFFANQNSVEHPEKDLDTNGHGILKVLKYSAKFQVKKLLYTSSSCVYETIEEMDEKTPIGDFDTPYAITKYLGEKYCRFQASHYNQDIVIVRLFNSYGPGEFPGKYRNVIPNFFNLAMNNEVLPITGDGNEIRDFNFVEDTVQGIIRAMFGDTTPGDIFNIASGHPTKIRDLAELINKITGNTRAIRFFPRRGWDAVTKRIGIIDKAVNVLGYSPSTSLSDGLAATYNWLKQNKKKP